MFPAIAGRVAAFGMGTNIEVYLSNAHFGLAPPIDIEKRVCLVIDVIRATSTIAAALGRGAERVVIAPSVEKAFEAKLSFPDSVLCGEEKGFKIDGFDFDNSPLRLSGLDLSRRNVVLKTTNGTESILKARKAGETAALSLLNFRCTMNYAVQASKRNRSGLLFLCAGIGGEVSYDDVYVAGLGVRYAAERCESVELSDTALLALEAASNEKDAYEALARSKSGRYGLSIGLGEDIRFCSRTDTYETTGVLEVSAGPRGDDPCFSIVPR
jgi:2-phosphosulfolactate phosphatase